MAHSTWPSRPLILASVLGLAAYATYLLTDNGEVSASLLAHWRIAVAAGLAVGSIGFGLCALRNKLGVTLLYAVALGLLVTAISYWRLYINWPYSWNFFSLATALLIITPFFQTHLSARWNSYPELHKHAWGNTVILALAAIFTAISFGMSHLLAQLFELVGVGFLTELLKRNDVNWILGGIAFGGAMGVLREHDHILDAVQRLVQSVLSLLAAPLSLGLVVFIGSLPLTGLDSLWEATRRTSPVVLTCAAGAILLLNAIIRDTDKKIHAGRILRFSARVLAFCVAPLAAIAVVSTYTRVQQYGWTPDRIWASLISALMVLYGLCYLVAALRGKAWSEHLRSVNLGLTLLTSMVALLLATPLLDFGAFSSRDQIQRLLSGQTSEEDFDTTALAFDFGPAGRTALETLDTSKSKLLQEKIQAALKSENRWDAITHQEFSHHKRRIEQQLQVLPANTRLSSELLALLEKSRLCQDGYCYFLMDSDHQSGTAVQRVCEPWKDYCEVASQRYQLHQGKWINTSAFPQSARGAWDGFDPMLIDSEGPWENPESSDDSVERLTRLDEAAARGELRVREVQGLQLFVGGEPVGPIFE